MLLTISHALATLGGIGTYCPAPGTVATAATLMVMYCVSFFSYSVPMQCLFIGGSILLAYICITHALPLFNGKKDPSAIVIDELIGTCITFIGISVSLYTILVGFIAFRVCDIYKPFGIAQLESLPGACGIIADDIAAGVCAFLIVHLYSLLLL